MRFRVALLDQEQTDFRIRVNSVFGFAPDAVRAPECECIAVAGGAKLKQIVGASGAADSHPREFVPSAILQEAAHAARLHDAMPLDWRGSHRCRSIRN